MCIYEKNPSESLLALPERCALIHLLFSVAGIPQFKPPSALIAVTASVSAAFHSSLIIQTVARVAFQISSRFTPCKGFSVDFPLHLE